MMNGHAVYYVRILAYAIINSITVSVVLLFRASAGPAGGGCIAFERILYSIHYIFNIFIRLHKVSSNYIIVSCSIKVSL